MSVCTCVRCGHPSQVLGTSAADQLASESTHPARAYRLRNSTAAITPEAAAKLIAFLNAPENLELFWQIKTVTDGVAGLIKVKPPLQRLWCKYQVEAAAWSDELLMTRTDALSSSSTSTSCRRHEYGRYSIKRPRPPGEEALYKYPMRR
jgi:hypothetical protein